jgi:hypothetical protein
MRSSQSIIIIASLFILPSIFSVWLLFSRSNRQELNGNILKSHLLSSLFGVIVPADQANVVAESADETRSVVDVSYYDFLNIYLYYSIFIHK